MKSLFLLLLCLCITHAVDNNNFNEEFSLIDETHADFSAYIKSWGARIDDMVLGVYDYFEDENDTVFFKTYMSNHKDANLSWFLPVRIDLENNTSYLVLRPVLENNESKISVDKNLSKSINLFPTSPSQEKRLSVREAEGSFFMYQTMEFDENSSSTIILNNSASKDNNTSYEDILLPAISESEKYKKEEHSIDEFFLTRKLLEERDRSYIRVSFLQAFNSLGPNEFRFNIKARVHLTRSRKRLKLFIENFNDDSAKNIGKTGDEDNPSIGLEQESKTFLGIRPRYSVGFRGIDPFVRARYTFETDFGRWNFKPVQTFQYSIKDEFSEITELFLDTPTSDNTLLRFVIDRGSNSNDPGMHYDGFIQWFYHPRKKAGLSFNFGANGNTKYLNTIREEPPLLQKENRVYNYLFLVRWRENIWKKWLFYEIGPGINYHEQYDYRPNYNIFFGIDMFFGHI